jgi:pimeloyl-ACP methyl ester carboxylesterase
VVFDPASVPGEILLSQLTSYALPDRHSAYNAAIDGCIANLGDPAARVSKRLEDIAIPALAICGREDIRSDWRAHAAGVERMPNARLKIYEKCGHFSFFEHAGKFNADLAEFLGQHA